MTRGADAPDELGSGYTARARRARLRRPGRNVLIAVVLSYAAFFAYAVGLADTGAGPDAEVDGTLVVRDCAANPLVLGLRSTCTGTIEPGPGHLQEGTPLGYAASYSPLTAEDVGTPVPMHDTSAATGPEGWERVGDEQAPFAAKLAVGPLALLALGFWYVTAASLIARAAGRR